MIDDTSINYIEEIEKPKEEVNFNNIIGDKKIINALDKLTDKQREIIYCSIILENTEKGLSQKLDMSQQAVNKLKNKGLNKRLFMVK